MRTIDACLQILKLSDDGEALSPRHLKLVEMGVNGFLNEDGIADLFGILGSLEHGVYKDWYFGIRGLTLDHQGYVYWQGEQVEHFSFSDGNYSDAARAEAQALVKRLTAKSPCEFDINDAPDLEQLREWNNDGGCEATDGCWVEPDGRCPHGCDSWLIVLGLI